MTIIYGLSDPRTHELRYVGKTQRSLKQRMKEHRLVATGGRKALQQYCAKWLRSLYSHGFEPLCDILDEIPENGDWAEAEQFWIRYMRFLGCRLTNHTDGGDGLVGMKRPRDVIERGVAKRIGKPLPETGKQRMREVWTQERREANGRRLRGSKMTEDAKMKMRISAKARYRSPEELAACAARVKLCKRNTPEIRAKLRAAWTPERRKAQSARFMKNVHKRPLPC